jgi:hypothetical protein
MNSLLDKMYTMRFCLASTFSQEAEAESESESENIPTLTSSPSQSQSKMSNNKCICVGYNHVACVFKSKGKER